MVVYAWDPSFSGHCYLSFVILGKIKLLHSTMKVLKYVCQLLFRIQTWYTLYFSLKHVYSAAGSTRGLHVDTNYELRHEHFEVDDR